jgi:DoxX-like family
MNSLLWILQVLLALHTAVGAGWKIFNSEQGVPSLASIPHGVWTGLIGVELTCVIGLFIPALVPSLGYLVPFAALGIAVEMLGFSAVHLQSGAGNFGQLVYWLSVTTVCIFIAVGRYVMSPL